MAVAELCFCSMMVMVATAGKIVLRGVASDKSSNAALQVGCDWGGRGDCGGGGAALWDCALPITPLKCTASRPDTNALPSPAIMEMEGF